MDSWVLERFGFIIDSLTRHKKKQWAVYLLFPMRACWTQDHHVLWQFLWETHLSKYTHPPWRFQRTPSLLSSHTLHTSLCQFFPMHLCSPFSQLVLLLVQTKNKSLGICLELQHKNYITIPTATSPFLLVHPCSPKKMKYNTLVNSYTVGNRICSNSEKCSYLLSARISCV